MLLGSSCNRFFAKIIIKTEKSVTKIDVKIVSVAESFMCVIKPTKVFDKSNTACLHVKAIVNPREKVISMRICLRNSLLNFLPTINALLILCLISNLRIKFNSFIKVVEI